ncbi:virB8 family protein [Sphingomonas canadensis]|uniref:VirB8 family protein n=1 Tax=Sphingomonas canadensis TaxID=1219257 RepID=A0ABW3HG26_9SPHN|nr:VirB8/TrbF family protein [Sphingomonas canadensis]MCW3838427.1 VirB8/TrbF family protein [Sphingomonas canadensis]
MKMKAREELDAYYGQAEGWGSDQRDALAGSRRTAWIVASVASAIALLEAIALWQLIPLKTVEPYTLLVDKQTGYVQALKPLEGNAVTPDAALTQSFLVQYVIARESFDIDALQSNYRKVALWSEGQARTEYVGGMQATNPDSFLARLPRSTIVETRVKSISPMGKDSAMVRFETQRRDAGGQVAPAQPWVAVIRYRYSGEPMRLEDRMINPLGFQVQRYQRNAEALVPPDPAAGPAPATPASSPAPQAGTPQPAAPQQQPGQQAPAGVQITL